MENLFVFISFVFGTVMGSFYHVVATRLSNDESIIFPGSHCPRCNYSLKWYENIPIFSYLFLKGKCSNCHSRIPISYLIVEIVTGLLFAVCYHSFGLCLNFVIALIFISTLIIVIVSDIEYMIILDEVLIFSTFVIFVIYLFSNGFTKDGITETMYHVYSGLGAFLCMYSVKIIGDKLFRKESLGGGDIKLMFLFGLVIGFPMSIISIFIATFIAFPVALIILFSNRDNIIPFGPFLSMAGILIMIMKWNLDSVISFLVK